jgi:hypothetical protein
MTSALRRLYVARRRRARMTSETPHEEIMPETAPPTAETPAEALPVVEGDIAARLAALQQQV